MTDQPVGLPESDEQQTEVPEDQVIEGTRVGESGKAGDDKTPTSVPIDLSTFNVTVMEPNLLRRFEDMVSSAVRNPMLTGGEVVDFAVGSTGMPTSDGGLRPFILLTVFIPSAVVGEKVHMTGMIETFYPDQDGINQTISDMVGGLIEARQEQSQRILAQQAAARKSVNGLIIGQ